MWGTIEVNCLAKVVAISRLRVRVLDETMMGLLGGVTARFQLKDLNILHRREGLHL